MTTLKKLEEALALADELMNINTEKTTQHNVLERGFVEIYNIRKFISWSIQDLKKLY